MKTVKWLQLMGVIRTQGNNYLIYLPFKLLADSIEFKSGSMVSPSPFAPNLSLAPRNVESRS